MESFQHKTTLPIIKPKSTFITEVNVTTRVNDGRLSKLSGLRIDDIEFTNLNEPPIDVNFSIIRDQITSTISIPNHRRRKIFQKHFSSPSSQQIVNHLFWFAFCAFYQPQHLQSLTEELKKLSTSIAKFYTSVRTKHCNWFFDIYHISVSMSIFNALNYYFPGSKHNFTNTVKTEIAQLVSELLTGIRLTKSCINSLMREYFPSKRNEYLQRMGKKDSFDEIGQEDFIRSTNDVQRTSPLDSEELNAALKSLIADRSRRMWNSYSTSPLLNHYITVPPEYQKNAVLLKKYSSYVDIHYFGTFLDEKKQKKYENEYKNEWICTKSKKDFLMSIQRQKYYENKYKAACERIQMDIEELYKKNEKQNDALLAQKNEILEDKSGEKLSKLCNALVSRHKKNVSGVNHRRMQQVNSSAFKGTQMALYAKDLSLKIGTQFNKLDNIFSKKNF